jgi:hypothetical protein
MANITLPAPRAFSYIALEARPLPILRVGLAVLLFDHGCPIAVSDGGFVHFPDTPLRRQSIALINKFFPDQPHVRVPVADYDFVIASALARNSLPLSRRSNG